MQPTHTPIGRKGGLGVPRGAIRYDIGQSTSWPGNMRRACTQVDFLRG